jgi:hypothetical protein
LLSKIAVCARAATPAGDPAIASAADPHDLLAVFVSLIPS